MTREDTVKVLSILRGAYPQFYRSIDKQEAIDTINLWASMFAEDDTALVAAAVKALIASDEKGFPPVIGQIKSKMLDLKAMRGPVRQDALPIPLEQRHRPCHISPSVWAWWLKRKAQKEAAGIPPIAEAMACGMAAMEYMTLCDERGIP